MVQGFAAEYVGSVSGGVWSVGSEGKWVNHWPILHLTFWILAVSLDSKIWSQKCLFLKSLVFRKLAGCTEWTLKKLKRGGRERKREERRGRDKETKRGGERKREEETKDEGRRTKGASFWNINVHELIHELTMNWFFEHDCSELMRH